MKVFGNSGYKLTITGDDIVRQRLSEISETHKAMFNNALSGEAEDILEEAKVIIPFDTGTLHDSGKTAFGDEDGGFVAAVGFGDNTTNPKSRAKTYQYARYQHETNVKYLEIPFMRAISGMVDRIARKMKVGGK